MANRVTAADVEKLIDVDSSLDVDVFITTANALIEERLGAAGFTEAYLTEIERWLSAHLVAMHPRHRQLASERLGDANQSYAGNFGQGLEFTQFGQMVLLLDTSGKLKTAGKRAVIFEAL